jgi:hypothetical protein
MLSSFFKHLFFDSMNAQTISDNFNESTSGSSCNNLVRLKPQTAFGLFKDLVHATDHLHRESFLSDIIIWFHYYLDQTPCAQISKWWILPHSLVLFLRSLKEDVIDGSLLEEVNMLSL